MIWLKAGGIAAALMAIFMVGHWLSGQIRKGYEGEVAKAELEQAAANEVRDAKSYQAGLEDGRQMAASEAKVKVIYKKVPIRVQVPGACTVDPAAIELRNAARKSAYDAAVSAAGTPDAEPPGVVEPAAPSEP